nr:hypothetical protein CFP56_43416 [Quercus suber]
MGGIIEHYFRDIFTTSNPSGFEEILSGIHPAISEEEAGFLGCDFQASETIQIQNGINMAISSLEQSEVEFVKCHCCGLTEECTLDYIARVRERYQGRWICGLCAEAVKDESFRLQRDVLRRTLDSPKKEGLGSCGPFLRSKSCFSSFSDTKE